MLVEMNEWLIMILPQTPSYFHLMHLYIHIDNREC